MYMKSMLYFRSAVFANCSLVHDQSTEAHFFKADRVATRVCFIIENRAVLQKYAMRGCVHARACDRSFSRTVNLNILFRIN